MKPRILIPIILTAVSLFFFGCKKYLDEKPDQKLSTISSLADLQGLLEKYDVNTSPSADLVSGDDYFLSSADYLSLDFQQMRNMYTWQPANLFYPYTNIANDWNVVYNNVYIANTVLANMENVPRSAANAVQWDNIKGQALFLRAHSFYKAVSIWSLAYDGATASTDLGVALRLSPDFNETSVRASNAQSYERILADLKAAIPLLAKKPVHVLHGGRPAAYALASRTYLAMRSYNEAGLYADSCLQLYSTLLDYNSLNTGASYPLPKFNAEIIYDSYVGGSGGLPASRTRARIDPGLIAQYGANDLRLPAFFSTNADGDKLFRGSYEGASTRFNGIATDEVYLTRAECYARSGKTAEALADLNTLLQTRYKTGTFVPVTASSASDVLGKILIERRKELVMRGNRWMDVKRLNKEGATITFTRTVNGKVYTLPPNDPRTALAIPEDVIALSGMKQNPR